MAGQGGCEFDTDEARGARGEESGGDPSLRSDASRREAGGRLQTRHEQDYGEDVVWRRSGRHKVGPRNGAPKRPDRPEYAETAGKLEDRGGGRIVGDKEDEI